MRELGLWLMLGLCASLVGCSSDDGDDAPADYVTVVGPEGLSLSLPDGDDGPAKLVIPPGALSKATGIGFRSVESDPLPDLPAGLRAVSDIFEFTPHGLDLAKSVEITLPHRAMTDQGLSLLRLADATSKAWMKVDEEVVFGTDSVDFSVDHFSFYVVAEEEGSTDDGGMDSSMGSSGGAMASGGDSASGGSMASGGAMASGGGSASGGSMMDAGMASGGQVATGGAMDMDAGISTPAFTLDLADMVGGGDGTGIGSDMGIDPRDGSFVTTHLMGYVGCQANTFVPVTDSQYPASAFIDGVFCPDGAYFGTPAMTTLDSTGTGVQLQEDVEEVDGLTTYDAFWNGPARGISTGTTEPQIAAPYTKGITFDMQAIESAYGARPDRFTGSFAYGTHPSASPSGSANFLIYVDGQAVATDSFVRDGNDNYRKAFSVALGPSARFLTLLTLTTGVVSPVSDVDASFWASPTLEFDTPLATD